MLPFSRAMMAQRTTTILTRSLSTARSSSSSNRARVLVVGSGRMGHIRSSLLYANPRFDIAGVVDVNFDGAVNLATTYQVRYHHEGIGY